MSKRKLIRPTLEEERAINAGIAADPDTLELTADVAARLKPASARMLELHRRGRGKQRAPTKLSKHLRISRDVWDAFQQHTDKVTTSMDEVLRDFAVGAGWLERDSKSKAERASAVLAAAGQLARQVKRGVNPFSSEEKRGASRTRKAK